MNLVFIGAGYVGLVSGVMMSHMGHLVTCIDTDKAKIDNLKLSIMPIYEPDLEQHLNEGILNNRLDFVYGFQHNFKDAEAIFITVGTPALESGKTDLSSVINCLDEILPRISLHCLIVVKSTVPPGTTSSIRQHIISKGYSNPVASNPEFLREGSAVMDFLQPERIVIGTQDENAKNILKQIYQYLTDQNIPLINTDLSTAELIKYASNAFLATKVAFINEMSNLCEFVGGDIDELALGLGLDSRIGNKFLKAGPGFGGSCFPKDILGLAHFAKDIAASSLIVEAVTQSNLKRYSDMVEKIARVYNKDLSNVSLAILGITYKAGTDDVRNSPAIEIAKQLKAKGAHLTIYDPQGNKSANKVLPEVNYVDSTNNLWIGKDGVVILTEWPEFALLNYELIKPQLKQPIIIDLRNILEPTKISKMGYEYFSIGRKDMCKDI